MKNSKKILSLALTLAMILSAVFCTGAVASAEDVTLTTAYKDIYSTGNQYENINFDSFGDNLFSDPTVAAENFADDGSGKMVYSDDGIFAKNTTGAYPMNSMKKNGAVVYDTSLSHTDDGSGVLKLTSYNVNHAIVLDEWQANSAYLITFWVKASSNSGNYIRLLNTGSGGYYTGADTTYQAKNIGEIGEWHRVGFIVTRNTYRNNQSLVILPTSNPFYVDDIAVYKLDNAYALKCMEAGELLATDGHAKEENNDDNDNDVLIKEPVVVNLATGSANLNITDGYFVPYGALSNRNGEMPEKQEDGTFLIEEAGEYAYTQFKYPTGIVGTYGASIKDGDDTAESDADKSGIQFGSLITDNLSVEDSGTLVIRGDFAAFRATLPTYSSEQIFKIIYNRLTKNNVAAGNVVRISNGSAYIDVMYVPRTTYMWKNSANTELQYAVRVFGIKTAYSDTAYTAVGYVTKDSAVTFSSEIKTTTFSGLN